MTKSQIMRNRITDLFKSQPLRLGYTDAEAYPIYRARFGPIGLTPSGFRTRRSELVRQGILSATGRTGKTINGYKTAIWGLPA